MRNKFDNFDNLDIISFVIAIIALIIIITIIILVLFDKNISNDTKMDWCMSRYYNYEYCKERYGK